ncbi:MAG: energy transducer TonB [Candidatus Eiseniibacteriota bacterium]
MSALKHSSSRDAWIIAWALTLLLHALAIVGIRRLPPMARASETHVPQFEPVQLVFTRASAKPAQEQQPNFFTELPPDRKDVAPDKADFLSNVTSRARDQGPGGNSELPRMRGEGDAPMVALEPGGSPPPPPPSSAVPSPASPSPPSATSPKSPPSPAVSATPSAESRAQSKGAEGPAASVQPQDAGEARPAAEAPPPLVGSSGHSDMHQIEMDNPEGNASLRGDVSLNTIRWEYAPWLERFGRKLMEKWVAPTAYYLGILKEGGWAMIEVEIAPSGQLLRLDVLEQHGHPALITAAASALRSMAPMERLPADFPEKTLILRIRMIYPKIHPR